MKKTFKLIFTLTLIALVSSCVKMMDQAQDTPVIDEIEVLKLEDMQLTIRVVCSKGTYIRALARDIGEAMLSGAHLIALQRTQVGDIRLDDCMEVEDFIACIENGIIKQD